METELVPLFFETPEAEALIRMLFAVPGDGPIGDQVRLSIFRRLSQSCKDEVERRITWRELERDRIRMSN